MTNEEIRAKIDELGDLKDKPVTWENIFEILSNMSTQIMETMQAADGYHDKVADSLRHCALKLYGEAEYRRVRSMAFVLAVIGHTDPSKWRPVYDKFCEEYDKLNRKE